MARKIKYQDNEQTQDQRELVLLRIPNLLM